MVGCNNNCWSCSECHEPTLDEDFPKGKKITTNGRAFVYRNFAQKIKDEEVLVKVFGHSQELHDSLTRVKGSFEQTIGGIRHLLSMGKDVGALVIATEQNFVFLEEIVNLLKSIELNKIIVTVPGPGKNYEKVMARFHDMEQYFQAVGPDVQFQGIPFCVLGKYRERSIDSSHDYAPKVCMKCSVENCPRIPEQYYELYGDELLQPECES